MSRYERIKIEFAFDKAKVDEHDKTLRSLFEGKYTSHEVIEGDTLNLTYMFDIDYIGKIADKLKCVQTLVRDKGLITNLDVKELFHSECLVEEVLKELRTLVSLLEKK